MLNHAEIAAVVAALSPRVDGGQVQKIRDPDRDTIALRVRVPGRTTHLVLSAHPRFCRIGAATKNPPTRPEPTTLGRWLRSTISGRRLVRLEHIAGDRVVIVHFEDARLVAELSGRAANLYGLDAEGRIMATAHRPARGERDLRPGRIWTPPRGQAPDGPVRFTDPEAVEAHAQAELARLTTQSGELAARRLVKDTRKRLTRLAKKVRADVARTTDAERWRVLGELLTAQLHTIQKGAQTARVQDWYAEGAPFIEIPLDPALDGPANAARYFAKYKKAKAGVAKATERLAEVEEGLALLDVLAEETDLDVVQAELRAAGLYRAKQVHAQRREDAPRLPYRPYTSLKGEAIWVGRGGADNHQTTFRHARGNDYWLHVRDAPGSHVIVPTRGNGPHPETLKDAAALAVQHSKLRGEPGIEVMVTQRKHVRAVKGAGPGRVTVADARTVVPDDVAARIARLAPRRV
jgi:predicted ribosome quality control (RQC) complex YloA/Tae2 family protein